MNWESGVPSDAQREVRHIVLLSRLAGLVVVASLAGGMWYLHRRDLASAESVYGFATIAIGSLAFVAISTLTRLSHAGIITRSLQAVQSLSDRLRDVAERDPLTGVYNLRAFQQRLQIDLEDAAVREAPASLIIADLDNFKLLNDSFGHQYGDEVLRRTARVFERAGDERTYVARLGGDEFAVVLPGIDRAGAVEVARSIEEELREARADERQPATLGSFGVATYPTDGATVQALFSAADGRMYSEKHHRKAEALSSLAGVSRRLFVRVGQAMRPDRATADVLREIAEIACDQFGLLLATIEIAATEHHERSLVRAANSPELAERLQDTMDATPAELAGILPPHAWIAESVIPGEGGDAGTMLLAGLPDVSFRPDTSLLLALGDLISAVVASGRAQMDAARAGRERDIHIDLGHELAGPGSLQDRLSVVVRRVAGLIGSPALTIESLRQGRGAALPPDVLGSVTPEVIERWKRSRSGAGFAPLMAELARTAPCVLQNPADDDRLPAEAQMMLRIAGITAIAIVAIRLDDELLGVLAAASRTGEAEAASWLPVLTAIADHLAPVMKVAILKDELEASYRELERASRESLARLADAAEARDPHTGGHLRRIQGYSYAIAREIGLDEAESRAIAAASMVHDLGKLELSDSVLMNPGLLDAAAWNQMMRHPAEGERLIGDSPMFALERCVARGHHERWDGSGYPDGLTGEEIPLAARIVAVADAFDALTTVRPYKPAWPLERAFTEIDRNAGSLFCPTVAAAVRRLWESGELAAVHAGMADVHDAQPLAA